MSSKFVKENMDVLTIIIVLIVLIVVLPSLGVTMPAPLGKILGIVLFVILLFWLLGLLGIGSVLR